MMDLMNGTWWSLMAASCGLGGLLGLGLVGSLIALVWVAIGRFRRPSAVA
jgi:hypothetical protein